MILYINGVPRPANEAVASITYQPTYDATRVITKTTERWDISGRIIPEHPTSSAKMTAALQLLNQTFSQPEPDLIFTEVDGTPTALELRSVNCLRGPYIIDSGIPNQADDVYRNGMSYRITFEAERFIGGGSRVPILEFSEQLSSESGGEEHVYVGGAVNFPERQVAFQRKQYVYTQSGRAVGLLAYPFVPPPIWPFAQMKIPRISKMGPRKIGKVDTEYEISWSYEFEWHQPLYGNPHRLYV
jgi:hypothetical protein